MYIVMTGATSGFGANAAGRLAVTLNHHLFDTLYHATALSQPNAALVTADERYFSKAAALGQIVRLRDWSAPCSA